MEWVRAMTQKSKLSFRIIFIDGTPFVVTKYSGKNARSLFRAILEMNDNLWGDNYHHYIAGYPEPISHMDYNISICISRICQMLTGHRVNIIYLKNKDELWKS